MARITVEDCLNQVDQRNRFHLALMASRRARQLRNGARPLVSAGEDDYTVLALREVASGKLNFEYLDQVDRELEGLPASEDRASASGADSVAEAAEALGAGMTAGMGRSNQEPALLGNEDREEENGPHMEETPEDPELHKDLKEDPEVPEEEGSPNEDEG